MTDQIQVMQNKITLDSGEPAPFAKVHYYQSGTTTPVEIFADNAKTANLTNPVVADSAGRIPQVFFDGTDLLKVVITTSDDITIDTIDPAPKYQTDGTGADQISATPFTGNGGTTVAEQIQNNYDAISGGTTDPTFTGTTTSQRLRLTATDELDLASTDHAFGVGDYSGLNLGFDASELQARNNGAAAPFNINPAGGDVGMGDASSIVTISDSFVFNSGELSMPRARFTSQTDANNTSTLHGLQVGADSTTNLRISDTRVHAVNNSAYSTLNLNEAGGDVVIGNGSSAVDINGVVHLDDGSITAPSLAWQSDTGTGFRRFAASQTGWVTGGGTEAIFSAGTANNSTKMIQTREKADARYVRSAEIPTDLLHDNLIEAYCTIDPGVGGHAPGTVVNAADLTQAYTQNSITSIAGDPITGTWKNIKRVGQNETTVWVRVT